jgi:hypothetical protein
MMESILLLWHWIELTSLNFSNMLKLAFHKSRVTWLSSLTLTTKTSSMEEPKGLVNHVLGRATPPILRKLTTEPITFGSLAINKHVKKFLPLV